VPLPHFAVIPRAEQSGLLTDISGDGKRFVVRADEKLTAFPALESAIRANQSRVVDEWLEGT
jgi:hypothetical protein